MKALVIGVGNEFRSDDGVGKEVVKALEQLAPPGVSICESSGESFLLIEMWANVKKVILVDAIQSGAEPGTVKRFDAGSHPLPSELLRECSTHALSVPTAIELARSLGRLPQEVVFFGIEALHFNYGRSLSEYARRAVTETVGCVLAELNDSGNSD